MCVDYVWIQGKAKNLRGILWNCLKPLDAEPSTRRLLGKAMPSRLDHLDAIYKLFQSVHTAVALVFIKTAFSCNYCNIIMFRRLLTRERPLIHDNKAVKVCTWGIDWVAVKFLSIMSSLLCATQSGWHWVSALSSECYMKQLKEKLNSILLSQS